MTKAIPNLRIDLQSPVAVYRQIVDALRACFVEGELVPGDTLPSVRHIALELGITFNTVAQAYRVLSEEGWVDLQHGKRVTVLDRQRPSRPNREKLTGFQRNIRELIAQMRAEGLSPQAIASELKHAAARLE